MDTSYKFSYLCKTVSNFYGYHMYNEIKEITYRKKKALKKEGHFYFISNFPINLFITY